MRYSANSVWENKDKYDVVVIGAGTQVVRQHWRRRDWAFRHWYLP